MMWLATPEPRNPPDTESFLAKYDLTEQEVGLMMVDVGFWLRVVGELTPWRRELGRVRQACLNNALDSARPDQAEWMDRFERICKVGRGFMDDPDNEAGVPKSAKPRKRGDRVVNISRAK